MYRVIVAQFSHAGDGRWTVECTVDGQVRPAKTTEAPDNPDKLLEWILPERVGAEDLEMQTCRLRLRPKVLSPTRGPMPPVLCWPRLVDRNEGHVLERGWTLLHMTATPGNEADAWTVGGDVVVLRDRAVVEALRPLPDIVAAEDASRIKPGSVVLVPGNIALDEALALQKRFWVLRCPLVVWCGDTIPPEHDGLLEVVSTGERHPSGEDTAVWLKRLVQRLQAEEPPEDALVGALREGATGSLDAWMLRGMLRPWKYQDSTQDWRQRFRLWRHELDREDQSARMKTLATHLITAPKRRLQVVLVPGEHRAGLRWFRERTIRPDAPTTREPIVRVPPWVPDTDGDGGRSGAFDAVLTHFKADDAVSLAARLRAFARPGEVTLVRLNHEVLTLGDGENGTVSLGALRGYVLALRELAPLLDAAVRVLVCLHVATHAPKSLSLGDFTDGDALPETMSVRTVEPLLDALPEDEIDLFLEGRELEPDDVKRAAAVKALVGMDYDAMIGYLNEHYGKKLR